MSGCPWHRPQFRAGHDGHMRPVPPHRPCLYPRPLTAREDAVLTALLSVDVDGIEELRAQAAEAQVFGGCDCGAHRSTCLRAAPVA